MPEVDLEILPIVVAGIIPMLIGALWYSPLLFEKQWMKLANMSPEAMKANPASKYLIATLANFLLAFVLFHFASYAKVDTNMEALQFAWWVWVGIVVTTGVPNHVFDSRPWGLFAIYQAYQLVCLVLMSLVLVNL